MNDLDFQTKKEIAKSFGVNINSPNEEIEVMRNMKSRLLARHNINLLQMDRNSHRIGIYDNNDYCQLCGTILLRRADCTGCGGNKYWESVVVNILKWFNADSYPWFYIPEFKHEKLISLKAKEGRGGNFYVRIDIVGKQENPFNIVPRITLPDWGMEVNEGGHFDDNVFQMKPSDYLKWDFCLRNRIPLVYINLIDIPDIKEAIAKGSKKLTETGLIELVRTLELIMSRIREYIELKRTVTDQQEIDSYFIEHFCELPYKKIELHKYFDKTSELKEICFNLTSFSETQLKEYVREIYFQ